MVCSLGGLCCMAKSRGIPSQENTCSFLSGDSNHSPHMAVAEIRFCDVRTALRFTYDYFLKPEGMRARFWVLTCPSYVGTISLTIAFLTAIFYGWQIGHRGLLACLIPWWLTAFQSSRCLWSTLTGRGTLLYSSRGPKSTSVYEPNDSDPPLSPLPSRHPA
jgi:hypothetical protein